LRRQKRIVALLWLVLLAVSISLLAAACTNSTNSKPHAPGTTLPQAGCNADQWSLDFTRSGGFAGRTLSLHLLSSGLLTASGQGAQVRVKVPADKLALIGQLLREACPFPGSDGASPQNCADCFSYTLQIGMGGQTYFSQVTEGHLGNLAPLLGALNALLESALAGQT
jgi:hypothetical protein